MEQIALRIPKDLLESLKVIRDKTKSDNSKIIRKALEDYIEKYFSDNYLIPRIYEEWAKDDFRSYPIEELFEKNNVEH